MAMASPTEGRTTPRDLSSAREENSAFDPADFLCGRVSKAETAPTGRSYSVPGIGSVAVWSDQRRWRLQSGDLNRVAAAPLRELTIAALNGDMPADRGWRPLEELAWTSAFHASNGRIPVGRNRFDVVRVTGWPNLTRVPTTANTARVIALLCRTPATIAMVHRRLHIAEAEVNTLYSALLASGLIDIVHHSKVAEAEAPTARSESPRGFWSRLFDRISGL